MKELDLSRRQPLLHIRDLSVAYRAGERTTYAIRDLDLEVQQGQFLALVGQSGSGKSTLVASLMGVLAPGTHLQGSMVFDGLELVGLAERAYSALRGRRLGLVPQDPGTSLNPVLTIGRQVSEVFQLHAGTRLGRRELEERSVHILDLAGVDRPQVRMRQYPHELSGGLKQRVLIAMAFGMRPDLLIADEPTSALDVTVQKHVLETFDRLAEDFSTTVIFVTHDLAIATDHASHVAVMHEGTLVEAGPVDRVVHRPAHAYTRRLLAAAAPHFMGAAAAVAAPERDPNVPRSSAQTASLRAMHLTKIYPGRGAEGPFRAVDDVSFLVRPGTIFSLVGESGSGKTTTARMVLGLVQPSGGSLEIGGEPLAFDDVSARRHIWRRVQYVYQNPWSALDPRMSVTSIIAEPLVAFGIGNRASWQARVRELLDQVALPRSVARRLPRDLSGGQRQRVAIARALALRARILVLDEPLSALDVVTQAQILELLESLQRELGLSYLFISHDLSVVREISDDVGVMHRGKLIEVGPAARVFGTPTESYTRQLLDAVPGKRFGSDVALHRRAFEGAALVQPD